MDPVTSIVLALAAGSSSATPAIRGVYNDLKDLIGRKWAGQDGVQAAIASLESKPDSQARRSVLVEELEAAGAAHDREVVVLAHKLLDLAQRAEADGARYTATLHGSGAIAQGTGAAAAGSGGIAVSGNVYGDIISGSRSAAGASADPTQPAVGRTREAEIADLQTQLDDQRLLVAGWEKEEALAGAVEAARLGIHITRGKQKIEDLEKRLDALQSR